MARTVEDFLVDFSKEEDSGGGGARYKPDTYLMRIAGGKTGLSENQSTPYLGVTFVFKGGKYNKKKLEERLYLTPKSIGRIRLLMEACDIPVPKSKKLDVTKLIPKLKGKELYVEIADDEREGYPTRSRVAFQGFINPDDYDPEDEDLDEEDEDLDEDEDEDEDLDEEDEDEEDEEPAPRRRSKSKKSAAAKPAKRRKRQVEDDEDEDEDEEDEDEEDEPAPRRKRTRASKAAPKKSSRSKRKSKRDDDDEDEDLDELDLDEM